MKYLGSGRHFALEDGKYYLFYSCEFLYTSLNKTMKIIRYTHVSNVKFEHGFTYLHWLYVRQNDSGGRCIIDMKGVDVWGCTIIDLIDGYFECFELTETEVLNHVLLEDI